MDFPHPIPVQTIAAQIGATLLGDDTLHATGINEIHHVRSGDITFSDVKKYFEKALKSKATIIILPEKTDCPVGKALLICEKPFDAYDQLIRAYRPFQPILQTIHPTAQIDASSIIEPGAIIANDVVIGKNCHIQSNVVIAEHTIIGDNVVIQAGALIGTDAFYFKKTESGYQRWRSGGRVVLEDGVEIGAGCTISKGVSSDTLIGAGTKLDTQVHIGHDVKVGKNCLFAAQVGIGGNTTIGDNVVLYGQVGIAQNLNIGSNVVILAKSGVSKYLEEGKVYFGYPAGEARGVYRELAALRQLPAFLIKNK